jgi:hypothetical protein
VVLRWKVLRENALAGATPDGLVDDHFDGILKPIPFIASSASALPRASSTG